MYKWFSQCYTALYQATMAIGYNTLCTTYIRMLISSTSYTCNILCRFTVRVDGVTGRARESFALKNGIYQVIHEQDLM